MALPEDNSGTVFLVLKRKWFVIIILAVLIPWVVVFFFQISKNGKLPQRPLHADATQGKEGPWGLLEFVPIIIAPPLEFVSSSIYSNWKQVWRFPDLNKTQFDELLLSFGITEEQRKHFLDQSSPSPEDNGFKIVPDDHTVLSLSTTVRQRLYIYLGQYSSNASQHQAYRFCGKSVNDWFSGSNLPEALVRKVGALSFKNNGFLFFADYQMVTQLLTSPDLIVNFNQRLYAQSTFLIKLHIDSNSDIEEIVNYWGRGDGSKMSVRSCNP